MWCGKVNSSLLTFFRKWVFFVVVLMSVLQQYCKYIKGGKSLNMTSVTNLRSVLVELSGVNEHKLNLL